jgi:hypothetical protein
MRVPCLCTQQDYECDVDYVKDAGGQCVPVPDVKNDAGSSLVSSIEDCQAESFYYVSQGYRKIPGNKCYGGVQLDPIKKPCNGFAVVTNMLGGNAGIIAIGLIAVCYFGWPQIEPYIATLPIPDPKEKIEQVKAFGLAIFAMLMGLVGMASSAAGASSGPAPGSGYESNLDKAPEAYLEGSDEEGDNSNIFTDSENKADEPKVNFDNDSSNEEEPSLAISGGDSTQGSELIDLGGEAPSVAKKIPKLSGPGK